MSHKRTVPCVQINWRIMHPDDLALLEDLRRYAEDKRISRNTAITQAVRLLSDTNKKKKRP